MTLPPISSEFPYILIFFLISAFLNFGTSRLTVKKNVEGTTLTDDEVIIASSLKQFALFLTAMETEMSLILEHANQKFIQPLDKFGKEHIGQFFAPPPPNGIRLSA
jgi:hypothetical protein